MPVNLEQLILNSATVFSLPDIYLRLNNSLNNPRSAVTEIGNIISDDQGLTARLLKIANSPLYGFPSRIETIAKAVLLIGTQQIRDLALATSIIKLFEGIPEELISMEKFWRHSIACAVVARVIAGYRREPNIEQFFTAGILHDIGRLIMFSGMADQCRELMVRCRKDRLLLHKAEREFIGFDHADVGSAMLKKWKIPFTLIDPVEFHHNPAMAGRYPLEAAIIHVADIIAHALKIGSSGNVFVPPLHDAAWSMLNLPSGILAFIIEQTLQQYDVAIGLILPGKNYD